MNSILLIFNLLENINYKININFKLINVYWHNIIFFFFKHPIKIKDIINKFLMYKE